VVINLEYGGLKPVIFYGFNIMKKFILASLLIFPPVNLGTGLLFGIYQTDQPLKIIAGLIISTVIYIVPMYFLLKSKNK
jgi:hypothetical protein